MEYYCLHFLFFKSISFLFFLFFKINLFILFIYFLLRWVLVAACRLFLVAASRGYSSFQCAGFSLWWLLLLRSMGSRRAGFSSCGTRVWLLRSMWDLPRPGLKPMPPALAGGFLTTAPPGKPYSVVKRKEILSLAV